MAQHPSNSPDEVRFLQDICPVVFGTNGTAPDPTSGQLHGPEGLQHNQPNDRGDFDDLIQPAGYNTFGTAPDPTLHYPQFEEALQPYPEAVQPQYFPPTPQPNGTYGYLPQTVYVPPPFQPTHVIGEVDNEVGAPSQQVYRDPGVIQQPNTYQLQSMGSGFSSSMPEPISFPRQAPHVDAPPHEAHRALGGHSMPLRPPGNQFLGDSIGRASVPALGVGQTLYTGPPVPKEFFTTSSSIVPITNPTEYSYSNLIPAFATQEGRSSFTQSLDGPHTNIRPGYSELNFQRSIDKPMNWLLPVVAPSHMSAHTPGRIFDPLAPAPIVPTFSHVPTNFMLQTYEHDDTYNSTYQSSLTLAAPSAGTHTGSDGTSALLPANTTGEQAERQSSTQWLIPQATQALERKRKASTIAEQRRNNQYQSAKVKGVPQDLIGVMALCTDAQEPSKRPRTQAQKDSMKEVKLAGGSCYCCKREKIKCSGGRPCDHCVRLLSQFAQKNIPRSNICNQPLKLAGMNLFKVRDESGKIPGIWIKILQPMYSTTMDFRMDPRFNRLLRRFVFRCLDVLRPPKFQHLIQPLDQPSHVADPWSLWTGSLSCCYQSILSLQTTIAQVRADFLQRAMAVIKTVNMSLISSPLDCLDHIDWKKNIRVGLHLTKLLYRVITYAKNLDIVDPTEASALLGHLENRYNYYSSRSMDSKHKKTIQHLPPDELDFIAYIDCIVSEVQELEHLLRRYWSSSTTRTNRSHHRSTNLL